MGALKVSRGNCPCLVKGPEAHEPSAEGFACRTADCGPEAIWQAMPPLPDDAHAAATPLGDEASQALVRIRLSSLRGLYDGYFGDDFLLVAAPSVQACLRLHVDEAVEVDEMAWLGPESRAELLERLRASRAQGRRTSILWLADDEFVHLGDEHMQQVKLAAVSWFSTGFTVESFARYVEIIAGTDYNAELAIESKLLAMLEGADRLTLRTPSLGTSATFDHKATEHWFSLQGPLRWGDQTVLPTGEMSVLTHESGAFDSGVGFALNGTIALQGSPIVHRGDRTVLLEDTRSTYERLSPMHTRPVIAHVNDGWINDVTAPDPSSARLRDAFLGLFRAEPRYRRVHEFGFGTHVGCRHQVQANFHPNERQPGIHLGLGLGGHTPFHIDLALPEVDVVCELPSGSADLYGSLDLRG